MTVAENTRAAAIGALALGVIGLVVVLVMSGSSYTLNVRFLNAGGLVSGGSVEIAGRTVGSIAGVSVTANGEANVQLSLDGGSLTPLRAGTRASIRAVGQAGITSNFVVLTPGPPGARVLPSGSVLSTADTTGIVPIDALLDSFGPAQRSNLDQLIASGAQIYAGSGGRNFNAMLAKLNPALGSLEGFSGQLALDRGAIFELVQTGSTDAGALASRGAELTSAVVNTAQSLGAIASQRAALADALSRMPPVLTQARGTLAQAGHALAALRPTLRDVVPAAGPLHQLLVRLDAMLPEAAAVLGQLRDQLPALNRSLADLKPLAPPAIDALNSLGPAMGGLSPIFEGFRFYGTDLIMGVLAGFFGALTGEYNADGHYIKANFVQSLQTAVVGPLSTELSAHPLVPGLFATRTGLFRRCPGGDEPPASDGSSPWNLGPKYCTAFDDVPLSVDFP